jgi:uncharacterized membrane protein
MPHKHSKSLKAKNEQNQSVEIKQSHEWILPPADELERLEKCTPWIINRFMTMAERDQDYYIKNHKFFFNKVSFWLNMWKLLSFIAFITINSLAWYMVYSWYSEEAVYTIIAELVTWLVAFLKSEKD